MKNPRNALLLLILISCIINSVFSFHYYVNTDYYGQYITGEKIPIFANSLTSARTQFPLDYNSLPFCPASSSSNTNSSNYKFNLGEQFLGYVLRKTPYSLTALSNLTCGVICKYEYTPQQLTTLQQLILNGYTINWECDQIPILQTVEFVFSDEKVEFYTPGYPLGFEDPDNDILLNNHLNFKVYYTTSKSDPSHIQIFRVAINPKSIKHTAYNENDPNSFPQTCFTPANQMIITGFTSPINVTFTYSVTWEKTEEEITDRWDDISVSFGETVHWYSISNSMIVVLILTGVISIVLLRTFNVNLTKVRSMQYLDEDADDKRWKLLHADVFRPPRLSFVFASLIGFGLQCLLTVLISLVLASIGFLSPISRGSFVTVLILLFYLMAVCGGYCSGRLCVIFGESKWSLSALMGGVVYPLIFHIILLFLNIINLMQSSSSYIGFSTILLMVSLWIFVCVPLTFWGNYIGFANKDIKERKINESARNIPAQNWYLTAPVTVLLGGIIPFGGVFVELFLLLSAIWLHQYYFANFVLLLTFVLYIVLTAEINIIMTYQHLCSEDYRWWWRALLTSGITGVYFFGYSIYLFVFRFKIDNIWAILIYFGYSFLMSLIMFSFSCVIGFFSCYLFIDKIYSVIKID